MLLDPLFPEGYCSAYAPDEDTISKPNSFSQYRDPQWEQVVSRSGIVDHDSRNCANTSEQ